MAGDWIKFEMATPDKPEVVQIASLLKIDQDAVVGKLVRIWIWADINSVNGGAVTVTEAFIDRLTGRRGFAIAMRVVKWLEGDDGALTFPNFERHNGKTAKARAMENRKKASQRERGKLAEKSPGNVPTDTGQNEDKSGTKGGDQRREEKSNTPVAPKGAVKGPLQLRAEKLMRRRPETPLTAAEQRAFKKNSDAIKATTEEDWQNLERFYAAPQQQTYARKDLATLINSWNGEIDRARAWCQQAGKQPAGQQGGRPQIPEPMGWRPFVASELPDCEYAPGKPKHGTEWAQIPTDYQKAIVDGMKSHGL